MDEAVICDTVALLQNGKILSVDTPAGIVADYKNPLWSVRSDKMLKLLNEIKEEPFVQDAYPFGEYHHIVMKDESGSEKLELFMKNRPEQNVSWKPVEPDIEDCFIALMKQPTAS
jgi:ABC-type multidrug transport system ATPase subunit